LDEVQRRVVLAIGKVSYSLSPSQLLPMLPNEGTKKLVSSLPLLPTSSKLLVDCVDSEFLAVVMIPLFCSQLKSADPIPVKPRLPQDVIRNRSKVAAERRRADRTTKHKK
jgi:hypothetical protein